MTEFPEISTEVGRGESVLDNIIYGPYKALSFNSAKKILLGVYRFRTHSLIEKMNAQLGPD